LNSPTLTLTVDSGPATGQPYVATVAVAGLDGATVSSSGIGSHASLDKGTVSLTYYAGSTASGTPLTAPPVAPGHYTVVATFSGSENHASATITESFTISPKSKIAGGG
jgi:hypothetical protein